MPPGAHFTKFFILDQLVKFMTESTKEQTDLSSCIYRTSRGAMKSKEAYLQENQGEKLVEYNPDILHGEFFNFRSDIG